MIKPLVNFVWFPAEKAFIQGAVEDIQEAMGE